MDDDYLDTYHDEFFELRQKGLFVRPPGRSIDLNTFPADGNEFIYRSKLEDALIEFPSVDDISANINEESKSCEETSANKNVASKSLEPEEKFSKRESDSEDELDQNNIFSDLLNQVPVGNEFIHWMDQSSIQFPTYGGETGDSTSEDNEVWIRIAAKEFSEFANALQYKRDLLEVRYPPKKFPNVEDEKGCCLFCLGSETFTTIYKESSHKKEAHLPLLNYVIHLSQKEIITVLKHSFKWFLDIGMIDLLGKWVCALFACLKKPLSKKHVAFLEVFYDACKEHKNTSEGEELVRLHFISTVLLQYFCVKAYQVSFPGK